MQIYLHLHPISCYIQVYLNKPPQLEVCHRYNLDVTFEWKFPQGSENKFAKNEIKVLLKTLSQ